MADDFLYYFAWITDLLKDNPPDGFAAPGTIEHEILTALKNGWGTRDTAGLLRDLTAAYGEKAGETVEYYIAACIRREWADIAKREKRKGTEIDTFIRLLWEPLLDQGFCYTTQCESGRTVFTVTKCPVYELAERTGLHDWLYHLACSTDYHTPGAFCPRIGFARTKTLMRGDDHCDHQYFYIDDGEAANR